MSSQRVITQPLLLLLFEVFRKRWLLILLSTLAMTAVVVVQVYRQSDYYQARSKVLFSPQNTQSPMSRASSPSFNLNLMVPPLVLATQLAIFRSDAIAERAARRLSAATGQSQVDGTKGARQIKGKYVVDREPESQIFLITATSGNAREAMEIANAVSEAYIEYNYDRTAASYKKSIQWLSDELVELERKLEGSQKELIEFIEREKMVNFQAGDRATPADPSFTLTEEDYLLLRRLHREKVELDLKLTQLLKRYRPGHPTIEKLTNDLSAIVKKLTEEETRLKQLEKRMERAIIGDKKKEIRYSILSRKVDVTKQLYDSLVHKLKETDIESAVIFDAADILEYAKLPGAPSGPHRAGKIGFAILFGFILSFGCAIVLDFLDTSLRTSEEVQQVLKLPLLASVPRMQDEGDESALLVHAPPDSPLREGYRTLRTNLRFSAAAGKGRSLMITSANKGEGKSTVALNIGLTNAESGKRTLVVDADFRARSLSRRLGAEQKRGLTEFLSEGGKLEDFLVAGPAENLWLLPSGPLPPKPSVLLESQRMIKMIEEASSLFDQVILDGPPVSFVIDSVLVAHLVEGVVIVVEAGKTSRLHVSRAVEQLERAHANILGVVLNKERRSDQKYYYSYYGQSDSPEARV